MNLTRIQYFVEVARRENFSQAAKALYVSQPNLSKQIALMEQELGFDLFRRVGKSVHVSPAQGVGVGNSLGGSLWQVLELLIEILARLG